MSVKTRIVEKLERVEVELAALPRPAEMPAVAAVTKKITALEEELAAFGKTKAVQNAATLQAQDALARAIAAGDKAARKQTLETLDDASAGLARVEARTPVLEKARLLLFEERAQAVATAIQSCGGEWDQARKALDACRDQLVAAERAVRESIYELEEARHAAFVEPVKLAPIARVRFVKSTHAGTSLYSTGEIAGFSLHEADRLVKEGNAVFVDEARAAAARELAARA